MATDLESFVIPNNVPKPMQPPRQLPMICPMAPSPPLPSAEVALRARKRNYSALKESPSATDLEESGPVKTQRLVRSVSSVSSTSSKGSSVSPSFADGTETKASLVPTVSSTLDTSRYTSADDVLSGLPPVDTSTDHVKALISSKGAAMCFDIMHAMKKEEALQACPSMENLSPEEKEKLSRDRK